jgi:hypothetical protein
MKRNCKKNRTRLFVFSGLMMILCLLTGTRTYAQSCGGCTVTISGLDTLTYTVNSGEILCIDSAGQFEGTITLNGGTVCNKGIFHPKALSASSGTITNHTYMRLESSLTLGSGLALVNTGRSSAALEGNLTISGGTLNNSGITNIEQNITFSSGIFSNTAIVNCKILNGAALASISNSGIINKD